MSTDPTQPARAPAPPEEPQADAPEAAPAAAPPTVQTPAFRVPPPPPPPSAPPAPPRRGQEPPTQSVTRRKEPAPSPAPTPPPPPGPQRSVANQAPPTQVDQAPPTQVDQPRPPQVDQVPPTQGHQPAQSQWDQPQTKWDQPPQPTFVGQTPSTKWDDPPSQRPRSQAQQPLPPRPQQSPQRWDESPRPWTEPQPWVEPVADRPQPPPPDKQRYLRRQRKRRIRRWGMALASVIVLAVLLVIGDRVGLAVTENEMASQAQSNGLPVKPSVTIEGFPFLTQLLAKDFKKVDLSAANIPVPLPTGGTLTITSVHATLDGMHISSYSSNATARVDQLNATAFVSFGALAAAGGIGNGSGITVKPAGPNTVKITANLGGIFSDSEEAQITTTGPQTISVKVLPSGSALGSVLSSFGSFSFNLPSGVPPSLKITKLDLNDQGLTIVASATDTTLSK